MSHRLYPRFLENPEEYRACEQFWRDLVAAVATSLGQGDNWEPWIPHVFADGRTPVEEDGNPIADGRSLRRNRAFRVIQSAGEGSTPLVAWIKTYGDDYPELPHDELVLNLVLSEQSASQARELLRAWMAPETTLDEMRVLIREREGAGLR